MKKNLPLPVYGFLMGWLLLAPWLGFAESGRKNSVTLVTGPETSDLLHVLGEPLQRAAGLQAGDVHFHVMLDSRLNAMALPGQRIIFNSGLLLAVRDRDELASVMAHEMGHLSAGHHIQLESSMKDMAVQTMIAFAAGIAAGVATGSGQLSQAAITGSAAAAHSALLDSMREKETQADRLAIRYMNSAGFDPQGMVRFMERLNREQRISHVPPPYLLTHPLSSQRLLESQQQLEGQSAEGGSSPRAQAGARSRSGAEDNALLARVQAVLEAGTTEDLNGLIARFRKRLELDPADFAGRYGLAVAERYMGQLPAAIADLELLLRQQPGDPYLLRERGLVRLELGQPEEAEADFRAALKRQPRRTQGDLLYRLAFALHEQEKWAESMRILRPLTLEHPLVAEYFYLLGVVEGKQGHLGASHLALARHFYLTMEKKMARWHYKEAIRLFASSEAGKAIARDELAAVEQGDKTLFRRDPSD
ncbi:MAG: tetratricopeptide repeat protein [Magnetococcus sp. MYC-9]